MEIGTVTGVALEGRRQEIYEWLYRRLWEPALNSPRATKEIRQGVALTRLRMELRPTSTAMLDYFWRAVRGTDKSIRFPDILRAAGLERFEDVFDEFRRVFPE
ncbi:MAG TPA: hypothetical protein VL967_08515 [Terracidiphilus sp.]|nr:hypothetical protein [Terracidiphilus sp.]